MRTGSWRKRVAVLAGVLLPLPLLVLLWGLLKPEVPADGPPGVHVSPILTHDQRMRLVTYGRRCGPGQEKCEPPLGCFSDYRYPRTTCIDSECLTDEQCQEGEVCRRLATWGDGPQVRRCIPVGPRQEGDGCVSLPWDKANACAPEWLCSGRDEEWCARPCRLEDSKGCPEGFFCADTVPQPACLPTCKTRGCPSGQQCIPFSEGVSVCARVYGPQCQQTPCPDGRRCKVTYDPPHPGMVWMECVEECGDGLPPCGAGKVCDGWHCLPACDPHGPEVCGEGYHCSRRGEDRPYSCQPLSWDETMAQ
ncbi:MAG TPA: hypothetical protein VNA24_25280 [Hyalangium sp.]|nr:hypothetical protein [Hyalangium sp.]